MPCDTLQVRAAPEFELVDLVLHPSRITEGDATTITVTVRNVGEGIGRAVVEIISNRERIGVVRIDDVPPTSTGSESIRYSPTRGTYEICAGLL